MEDRENIEAFINMVNENNKRQKQKEEERSKVNSNLTSKFKNRGKGLNIIAAVAVIATIGAFAGEHIKAENSYDPSNYYDTHAQVIEAISSPDTTTVEFLKEQGYDLSSRDQDYLSNPKIVSYLNKIHDNEGPDYEQVKNQFGDVVNANLEAEKVFLREAVNLPEDTVINIEYVSGSNLKDDDIRITYYSSEDEGILLVSDDIKNVIRRTVDAQNFAMEKGEGASGNTTVLNNSIAGVLELDDNDKNMRVVRAIDEEFKEHHK